MSLKATIVNIDKAPELAFDGAGPYEGYYKLLSPAEPRMGRLGLNLSRVPPGKSGCPLHTHQVEDEAFLVMSGRGVFRYGDEVRAIGPGDCIYCPAGTGVGHQIANPFDEDLVYLAIGLNDPNEVCTYPDSGKVYVRSLASTGRLLPTDYFDGEAGEARIFSLPVTGKLMPELGD